MREVFENSPPKRIERRRGRDKIGKAALLLLVGSWILWVFGLIFIHMAIPERQTVLDILFNHEVRTAWIANYLFVSLFIWLAGVIAGLMAYFMVRKRVRRRTDRVGITTFLSVIINALSIILMIITIVVYGI